MMVREMDIRADYYDNASPGEFYRVTCKLAHIPTGTVAESDHQHNRTMAKRQATDRLLAKLFA